MENHEDNLSNHEAQHDEKSTRPKRTRGEHHIDKVKKSRKHVSALEFKDLEAKIASFKASVSQACDDMFALLTSGTLETGPMLKCVRTLDKLAV